MTLAELRARVDALRTEVLAISDATPEAWAGLESDEVRSAITARGDYALAEFTAAKAELATMEERARQVEQVRATHTETTPGADSPEHLRRTADLRGEDLSRMRPSEVRDAALKVLETEGRHLASHQKDHLEALLRTRNDNTDGAQIARRLIITESDAYRSAFQKGVTQEHPVFTAEEARAINEFRAAAEGTGSAGGFGIPVLIDPTIILTSGAVDAPILQISRTVTITTDAWKGVSSAGVTWSYDAEASAVSDDSPTLAQPNIPVYAARGFIPYSIEVGQDYPGFADEMAMLLSQGFVNLVAQQTMTGSGSSQPTGIFQSMQNVTTNPAHVTVTTAGSIAAADFRAAWAALPERFRNKATWVYSPTVQEKVSAFGNNLALSDFTQNLGQDPGNSNPGSFTLLGRPVIVGDYAPAFSSTTGATNYAVFGDFSNYLIVQRAGMTVELVNHLFDTSTGRPTGQRGWFAWARHGFDQVAPNAFRLLSNS